MDKAEVKQVEAYLRRCFSNQDISLILRPQANDSVEFEINGETLGIVYRDDEDGDVCYHVQLTVFAEDLLGAFAKNDKPKCMASLANCFVILWASAFTLQKPSAERAFYGINLRFSLVAFGFCLAYIIGKPQKVVVFANALLPEYYYKVSIWRCMA